MTSLEFQSPIVSEQVETLYRRKKRAVIGAPAPSYPSRPFGPPSQVRPHHPPTANPTSHPHHHCQPHTHVLSSTPSPPPQAPFPRRPAAPLPPHAQARTEEERVEFVPRFSVRHTSPPPPPARPTGLSSAAQAGLSLFRSYLSDHGA
jgi:hypothetical protein